jgi:hypothetical protein
LRENLAPLQRGFDPQQCSGGKCRRQKNQGAAGDRNLLGRVPIEPSLLNGPGNQCMGRCGHASWLVKLDPFQS